MDSVELLRAIAPDCFGSVTQQLLDAAAELERLREENQWLKSRHEMHSPKMDGEHQWRAVNRWPRLIGPTIDEAVQRAMVEQRVGYA